MGVELGVSHYGENTECFSSRVLRNVFGPVREAVTRGWRKLHNENLHNLYFLPNIVKVIV
jgi:hypothetical protein